MFLQRLPVTLRTLLGEQEPDDIRSLAARADKLLATHKQQSHNLVANEEQSAAQIAAVQKKEPRAKGEVCLEEIQRPVSVSDLVVSGSGSGSGGLTHSEQAPVGCGICFYHWTHG
jgi:hypothetical protein